MITLKPPRKIAWNREAPVCRQTAYRPCFITQPEITDLPYPELIFYMGDRFEGPYYPIGDRRNKGTDKIHVVGRHAGPQQEFEPVVTDDGTNIVASPAKTFKYITEAMERTQPEKTIGSTASPSVFCSGDVWDMLFCATVGDPQGLAAHQFALFWQRAFDPRSGWTLRNFKRRHDNPTVGHAALWFGKFDTSVRPEAGITGVSALYEPDTGWLYAAIGVWPAQKNGLVRCQTGSGTWEIWKGWKNRPGGEPAWETIVNGELPDWYTEGDWGVGNPYPHGMSQIAENTLDVRNRMRRMCVSTDPATGCIEVAFSNDLLDWHDRQAIPWGFTEKLANVRDPQFTGHSFIFATNDAGVLSDDPAQYGQMGCGGNEYYGLVLAECEVEVA